MQFGDTQLSEYVKFIDIPPTGNLLSIDEFELVSPSRGPPSWIRKLCWFNHHQVKCFKIDRGHLNLELISSKLII